MKYNYLYDKNFLKLIDNNNNQTHYVRITILSFNEEAIATIEGIVTSGSINVNGSSAVRRTGSLSLVATLVDNKEIFNITDIRNLISIEKKVEIEVGFENNTPYYHENPIIWFPQGQFVITSAAVTHDTQKISISINIKDKMALLNGECGGTLSIGLTHSPIYVTLDNGEIGKEPVKFKDIIRTLVHEYGNIPLNKIIIDNIPDNIKNAVRWVGSYPIYGRTIAANGFSTLILTAAIPSEQPYDTYTFGDSIGYQYTDFVYPVGGELASNAGDTIVSVLDKVKNTLGNFEYFFDLDGNFRFQQIQDYINEGSSADTIADAIKEGAAINYLDTYSFGKSVYNFDNNELVTVFNNSPKYEAIKNDICVWGVRGDSKAALQYHLVIDTIPQVDQNKTWQVVFYEKEEEPGVIRARAPKDGETTVEVSKVTDYRTMMYYDYIINKSAYTLIYGKELEENWPKIYDLQNNQFKIESFQDSKVFLNNMSYYFEIIDPKNTQGQSILEDLKVSNIGRRTKTLNDDKINILLTPMPPNWVYIEAGAADTAERRINAITNKENFVQLPTSLTSKIALGAQTNSAYDAIRAMLHELISYNESVSLTTIPIYHLEPNTRITAQDSDIGVVPTDYIIKSFSVPLTSNGTMTIQCTRALERI